MRYLLVALTIVLLAGCGYLDDIDLDNLDFGDLATATPEPTATTAPTAGPTLLPTPTRKMEDIHIVYYIVEEDNTLWGIAELLYNDPEKWRDLYEANESIEDPAFIFKGQILIVPDYNCTESFVSDCYEE